MPCFSPIKGFRSATGGLTMSRAQSPTKAPMCVPCGQCLGCRCMRRDQWKARAMHEFSLTGVGCFITCTYAPEHRPRYGSVCMDDFSGFIKRLRARVAPKRFRFLAKSEYGPNGDHAPHYHSLLFGFDFEDRKLWRRTDADALSYTSELLTDAWGLGHCECSDLTPRSCGYVANHNVDKLDGRKAAEAYQRLDPETGEVVQVEPESVRMSTHPGIGRGWLDLYEGDCFPSNFLISEGQKVLVPKYYKRRLKDRFSLPGSSAGGLAPVDDARVMARKGRAHAATPSAKANSTPERLAVREEVLHLKLKRLKRDAI